MADSGIHTSRFVLCNHRRAISHAYFQVMLICVHYFVFLFEFDISGCGICFLLIVFVLYDLPCFF